MRRKVLTLGLEELLILENGRKSGSDAENILLVSLIWPRPMIDLRTSGKAVRIEDGERMQFSSKAFHEKILFKENVAGPFGVTLEVTERKHPGVVADFLAGIAAGVVKAAFPLPPASETFRRIVHAGAVSIGQRMGAAPRETILRIAFGHAEIDPQSAGSGQLDLPLTVPQTITVGSGRNRRTPILTEGQPNGQAILRYTIEED